MKAAAYAVLLYMYYAVCCDGIPVCICATSECQCYDATEVTVIAEVKDAFFSVTGRLSLFTLRLSKLLLNRDTITAHLYRNNLVQL